MKTFNLFDAMDIPNKNGRMYKYDDFLPFDGNHVYVLSCMGDTMEIRLENIVGTGTIRCTDGMVKCDFVPINDLGNTLQDCYHLRTAVTGTVGEEGHATPLELLYVAFTNEPA